MKRSALYALVVVSLVSGTGTGIATAAPTPDHNVGPARSAVAWSDSDKEDARRLSALDRIRARVESRPDIYAGITTNGPADVTIHVVKGREASADTGALRHEASLEKIAAKVEPVERSTTELKSVMNAIPENKVLAATLSSYGIDPATNRVDVGVTELTGEVASAVRAEFGDAVSLHVEERPQRTSGRFNDSSPFYGGIRFGNQVIGACSYGFSVTNAFGARYALTAGHCGPVGMTYAAMTSSGGAQGVGEGYAHFGTMQFRRLSEGDVDAGLVSDVDYGGRMWAHSNLYDNSGYSLPVHSSANSCQGCTIMVNGSFTGLKAALLTGPGNRCNRFDDGITSCGLQLITPTSGGSVCQGGDSGGPVFAYDGQGGVIAVGIITGSGTSAGTCYYTQVPTILNVWTSTITTG